MLPPSCAQQRSTERSNVSPTSGQRRRGLRDEMGSRSGRDRLASCTACKPLSRDGLLDEFFTKSAAVIPGISLAQGISRRLPACASHGAERCIRLLGCRDAVRIDSGALEMKWRAYMFRALSKCPSGQAVTMRRSNGGPGETRRHSKIRCCNRRIARPTSSAQAEGRTLLPRTACGRYVWRPAART